MAEQIIRGQAGGTDKYPDRDTLGISPYAAANRADYLPDAVLEPRRTQAEIWHAWGNLLLEKGISTDEAEAFVKYAEQEQLTDGQIARKLVPQTE